MSEMRVVYAMVHNPTGKAYIGSTSRGADRRIKNHLSQLKNGKHKNQSMQADYNEYGEDYSFYLIDTIPTSHYKSREYFWMAFFDTYNPEKGYNDKDWTTSELKISHFPRIDIENGDEIPRSTIACVEKTAKYLGISVDKLLSMKNQSAK